MKHIAKIAIPCLIVAGAAALFTMFKPEFAGARGKVNVIGGGEVEYHRGEANHRAVMRIRETEGINAVAVLSDGDDLLVGVTSECGFTAEQKEQIKSVIYDEFGENANAAFAFGGAEASDIMELSYYLNCKMRRDATMQRFNKLFNNVRGSA